MPDGKPYHVLRGGNWYNGPEGHSRVSNRNPAHFRGPQDPDHPWYHVGFRIARDVEEDGPRRESGGPRPIGPLPEERGGDRGRPRPGDRRQPGRQRGNRSPGRRANPWRRPGH
jgi:hypothetical protein